VRLSGVSRLNALTQLNLPVQRWRPRGQALASAPFANTLDELRITSHRLSTAGARALLASPIGRYARAFYLGGNRLRRMAAQLEKRRVRKRPTARVAPPAEEGGP
jgi:hypothetical protein